MEVVQQVASSSVGRFATSPVVPWLRPMNALDFADLARRFARQVAATDIVCPFFRTPPGVPGVSRSLRRNHDGSVTLAVLVRDRLAVAVVADMVEGVLRANELTGVRAAEVRDELWQVWAQDSAHAANASSDELLVVDSFVAPVYG